MAPKSAAELARDWAKKGREWLAARRRAGRKDEVQEAITRLCVLVQARGYEALAKALDAVAEQDDTPPNSVTVCPSCGNVRPGEWTPPKD